MGKDKRRLVMLTMLTIITLGSQLRQLWEKEVVIFSFFKKAVPFFFKFVQEGKQNTQSRRKKTVNLQNNTIEPER